MARIGRIIIPGFPHHVTQRGNRCQQVFFRAFRLRALSRPVDRALPQGLGRGVGVLPHAQSRPPRADAADAGGAGACDRRDASAVHRLHQRPLTVKLAQTAYTCLRWTGHVFQGRFSSVALDEAHLVAAARYVALNPVRARLVARAQDWAWSSARAHLAGCDDGLVRVAPLIERLGRFADPIEAETDLAVFAMLRDAESTGCSLGSDEVVTELERRIGRRLQRQKPGRKSSERTEQLELRLSEMGKVSP